MEGERREEVGGRGGVFKKTMARLWEMGFNGLFSN